MTRSPLRYLAVGALCAAVHNLIVIGGAALGSHYLVSAMVSFVVVVVVGYTLHVHFTFAQVPSRGSFLRYAAAMAANYPLTVALLFLLYDRGGLPMAVASPAVTILLVLWNYAASHWAIARQRAGRAQ